MAEGLFGFLGVIVGAIAALIIDRLRFERETAQQRALDEDRENLLRQMLDDPGPDGWRTMATLSAVIGANRDETARLLIQIGARASETGNDSWAYLSKKPLPRSRH